ncbi:uncharacterized protein DFL_002704 [Arthrobotrys flagrans]|uniref:Uncharacterized protein n=1 Tax=Arthrobotrys flagrans TaxID=97331 RepID=A0A437ABI2_ARTFL|nr:hypothetical protein DFL_002704 [Arthrobotrys flagrans]
MEAINQATAALRETVWGDGTPSGNDSNTVEGHGNHSEIHKSMIDDKVAETRSTGRLESDPDAEGAYRPGQDHDTHKRPRGSIPTGGQPQGANVTGDGRGTDGNTFGSSNEPNTGFGGSAGAQPSIDADPSSARRGTPHHRGGNKPTAEPDTSSTSSGGGAGGPPGMKLPDSENQSKGEGTGTKYEKSTGLAAEGGDFDATRPGAGREADRLMAEKGIAHGGKKGESGESKKEKKWYGVDHSGFGGHGSHQNKRPSVSSSTTSETPEGDTHATTNYHDHPPNEKKGLSQRIKEKFHHSSK